MNANNKKLILIFSVAIIVGGCVSQSYPSDQNGIPIHRTLMEKRIAEFNKVSKSEKSLIIPVPAPDNIISRKIMLASIKAGVTSNAIDSLVELLKLNAATPIAVISDENGSDDITAATIESAFQRVQGAKTKATLYFVGEKKYGIPLQNKAQTTEINYKFIAYPE